MQNTFDIIIPDQPFSNLKTLNKSITIEYIGDRFVMIGIERETDRFLRKILSYNLDESSSNNEMFDPASYETDYESVVVIDSESFLLECSLITTKYNIKKKEIHSEILVDGSIWTYDYTSLSDIFEIKDLKYDSIQNKFSKLEYRKPFLNDKEFWDAWNLTAKFMQDELNRLKNENIDTSLHEKYFNDLNDAANLFRNTECWKIPPDFGIKNPFISDTSQDSVPV